MEREVGGGIGMGNTCKPMAVSFQCMTKFTTNKKKKKEEVWPQVIGSGARWQERAPSRSILSTPPKLLLKGWGNLGVEPGPLVPHTSLESSSRTF